MTPEHRTQIVIARVANYQDIMRTVIFAFAAIAAVIHLGPEGYSAPLMALTVTATAYGIIAGNTALDDIDRLRGDIDEAFAATSYGRGILARNVPALKAISSVLIGLTGLACLYALVV